MSLYVLLFSVGKLDFLNVLYRMWTIHAVFFTKNQAGIEFLLAPIIQIMKNE